jgi:hypothetical protein
MNLLEIVNNNSVAVDGWAAGQRRWYEYDLNLSCDQGEAKFDALSPEQKLAKTSIEKPTGSYQYRNCGGTGPTDPGNPSDDLEDEIVFTGQNVSDAPSTNPDVMEVIPTYLGNGEWSAKIKSTIQPEAGKSLRICFDTMGYLSVAEIEGRNYPCGEEVIFQGYHMTGNGDDGQRSDSTINAHQLVCIM